jgi:predicted methyltransferase
VRNPRILFPVALAVSLALSGCGREAPSAPEPEETLAPDPAQPAPSAAEMPAPLDAPARLAAVLDAQPDEVKARYVWRNPAQTMAFFGIEPGMTVVELLPGGGWYTKILLPYLGAEGRVIGANYALDMVRLFGLSEEQLAERANWAAQWAAEAEGWRDDDSATVGAFLLGAMPDELKGTADAVLAIRALHNLARFEEQGDFLSAALRDIHDVLKPGGIVGVVQHEARPDRPDDWATGAAGYLKKDFLVERFREAGFELVGTSDINENPLDQATTGDVVWRLPPSLGTSREDPELRARMEAIGESNRMTLKFRKPAA